MTPCGISPAPHSASTGILAPVSRAVPAARIRPAETAVLASLPRMARKTRSRRRPGRGAAWNTSGPGYQACTFTAGQCTWSPSPAALDLLVPLPRPPPAAGRAWVPGCRVGTSGPSLISTTDPSAWEDLGCDQFVIFIEPGVHMSCRLDPARRAERQLRAQPARL